MNFSLIYTPIYNNKPTALIITCDNNVMEPSSPSSVLSLDILVWSFIYELIFIRAKFNSIGMTNGFCNGVERSDHSLIYEFA